MAEYSKRDPAMLPRSWWRDVKSIGSTDGVYTALVVANKAARVEDVEVLLRGWASGDNATISIVKSPAATPTPAGGSVVATLAVTDSNEGTVVAFDLSALEDHSVLLADGDVLYALLDLGTSDTITSPVEIAFTVRTWVQ
jgi:hypothetical protein